MKSRVTEEEHVSNSRSRSEHDSTKEEGKLVWLSVRGVDG